MKKLVFTCVKPQGTDMLPASVAMLTTEAAGVEPAVVQVYRRRKRRVVDP